MSTANTDAVDLAAVPVGGTIHEDVMDAIYDVSPVDRPFCDAIGAGSSDNTYKEWVREALEASSANNAVVDGADAGDDESVLGERLGNYHQIGSKVVRVSDRGRNVNTIGTSDELIRQIMKRQKALRRDEESALTSRNVAVAGDGDTVAGKTAGVGGWIGVKVKDVASTTSDRGATAGTDPVLSNDGSGGGGYPTTAAGEGDKRALSEATIKDMMRAAYENGGNPSIAMSIPAVIEQLSDYLFTSSARVATLQSNAPQGNRTDNGSGGGQSGGGVTAQGAVNILVTNFGTLELVPNRFQPAAHAADATVGDLYLIDPDSWERSYLQGYETKDLARTGIAENRQITVDFTLCALNPEANAVVADIDSAVPATA
jgi:hypothetical protein